MSLLHLRVEGIYDVQTFHLLKSLGVRHFGFDFRPLSLNFLPQHSFLEIVDKADNTDTFYLHYADEADFAIYKMLEDLAPWEQKGPSFYLEFSDLKGKDFYEQFSLKYFWHFQNSPLCHSLLDSALFEGFKLTNLNQLISDQFFSKIHRSDLKNIFNTDEGPWQVWSKHLHLKVLNFTLDQKMEQSYRIINQEKLHKEISSYCNLSNQSEGIK